MVVDTTNGVPTNAPRTCHKCGKSGHVQKDCRQNKDVPQNTHVTQNDGSPKCPHCNKYPNHTPENCFKNPNNPNFKGKKNNDSNGNDNVNGSNNGNNGAQNKDKKPQQSYVGYVPGYVPPYNGDQTYCSICNSTDHAGSACTFPTPHLYNSTMVCRNCCIKGHTDSDCKHPNPINCKICHKPGHKAEICRDASAEFYKQGSSIVKKDERFIWGSFDPEPNNPVLKLEHKMFEKFLKPQYQLELDLKRAEQMEQRGDEWQLPQQIDEEVLANRRQAVADQSIVQFPGQTESLHFIPLRHANVVPAANTHSRPFKVQKPQSSSRTTSNTSMPATKKSEIMNWMQPVTRANIAPAQPSTKPSMASLLQNANGNEALAQKFAAVFQRMAEEETTAVQKSVRAHIDRSTRLYRKQNYNVRIQQLSLRVVEDNILSDSKHLQVKLAMAQGAQFWRDPKAMEALVNYQRPVCHSCAKEGVIFDRHMRRINPEVCPC